MVVFCSFPLYLHITSRVASYASPLSDRSSRTQTSLPLFHEIGEKLFEILDRLAPHMNQEFLGGSRGASGRWQQARLEVIDGFFPPRRDDLSQQIADFVNDLRRRKGDVLHELRISLESPLAGRLTKPAWPSLALNSGSKMVWNMAGKIRSYATVSYPGTT